MSKFAQLCRECRSQNIQMVGGCPTCLDCGWSACF